MYGCQASAGLIYKREGMRAQALSGGVGAVLIKPFSEEAILSAIHSALVAQ
jgi:CheY-like chemotaxis protein